MSEPAETLPARRRTPPPEEVVLYSSWRGLVAALISPAALLGLGGAALVFGGVSVIPVVLTTLGVLLAAVGVFDYPRRCRFDASGVERICLLRKERLAWKRLDSIDRARGSWLARGGANARGYMPFIGRGRLAGEVHRVEPRPAAYGGLAGVIGRRRYLLVDQVESRAEWDALQAGLRDWAPRLPMMAPAPPINAHPTTLYHRRARKEA